MKSVKKSIESAKNQFSTKFNLKSIVGGSGAEVLAGGAGSDGVTTTSGSEVLAGGAGRDTYVVEPTRR